MAAYFLLLLISLLQSLHIILCARGRGNHYQAHDHVGIVANTVGPFNNPTETYPVRTKLEFIASLK